MPLETFTIRPHRRSSIAGSTANVSRATAVTLMASAAAHVGRVDLDARAERPHHRGVVDQHLDRTPLIADHLQRGVDLVGALTSAGTGSPASPRSPIIEAVCSTSSGERASTATRAPASASPRAMARPMPRPPPVTRATRPSNASFVVSITGLAAGFGSVLPPRCDAPGRSIGLVPVSAADPSLGHQRAGSHTIADDPSAIARRLDDESRRWIDELGGTGPARDEALTRLHELLLRVGRAELGRRSGRHPITGPELDDLAHQAADDALVAIMAKLSGFRGESQFTTWAYKFAVLEVSSKLGRHFWQRPRASMEAGDWDRLPDRFGVAPEDHAQQRELIARCAVPSQSS